MFGLSGLISGLLGVQHRHDTVQITADSLVGWQDFRRPTGARTARQPHSHLFWVRHHHSTSDASVVALDGGPQESSPSDAASATVGTVTLATAGALAILYKPNESSSKWPRCGPFRVATLAVEPPERPPRA
ncbi:MAG: hypothetical protein ABI281_07415 [Caldimonas sp.]